VDSNCHEWIVVLAVLVVLADCRERLGETVTSDCCERIDGVALSDCHEWIDDATVGFGVVYRTSVSVCAL
ncbi:unnamed protein product, partial [Prorocentrum cordatum]